MKIFKSATMAIMVATMGVMLVACGGNTVTVKLGTYSSDTFTALNNNAEYSLQQNGNTLTLKGTIPYSESILGVPAGNIVALQFMPNSEIEPDAGTSVKTTNSQAQSGWNEYGEEAIEDNGSIIWVTAVSKDKDTQIKIKWNEASEEVTYTLKVDANATLATE